MPKPTREEALRNKRLETFVRSPLWQRFEGGRWRRYRRVRAVTQSTKDDLVKGGYADGESWCWAARFKTEEEARQALFSLIETYSDERDKREAEQRRAQPPVVPDELWSAEDLKDWVWDDLGPEDLEFEEEEPFVLTDDDREMLAEWEAEIAEIAKDFGDPATPPVDFPAIPPGDG